MHFHRRKYNSGFYIKDSGEETTRLVDMERLASGDPFLLHLQPKVCMSEIGGGSTHISRGYELGDTSVSVGGEEIERERAFVPLFV